MASKPPSKKELDLQYLFKFKCLDVISLGVSLIIPWGACVLIAYWASNSIEVLAGKTTLAQIGVAFLGDFSISEALAYVLALGGMGYGFKEKALRRNTVERLQGRIQGEEQKDDPKRSSSKLTTRGTTRPQDKL